MEQTSILMNALNEEMRIYKALALLLDKQREALLSNDIEAIGHIVAGIRALRVRLKPASKARDKQTMAMAMALGIPYVDFTVKAAAELLEQDEAAALEALRLEFADAYERSRLGMELCASILEARRESVRRNLEYMSQKQAVGSMYGMGGESIVDYERITLLNTEI